MGTPSTFWREWSADLTRLHGDGLSARLIAEKLSAVSGQPITRNAVIGRVHRMSLPTREPRLVKERAIPKRSIFSPKNRSASSYIRFGRANRSDPIDKKPPTRPLPTDPCPESLMVKVDDLRPSHCRYIIGEPDGPNTIYCGAQRWGGSAWCPRHYLVVYVPVERRNSIAPRPLALSR